MANSTPEFKTTQVDLKLINHLFAFEGCELLNASLVSELIRLGWKQATFDEVVKIAPKCEHGGAVAYYSKQRNSLLIPNEDNPDSITSIEIEKNGTVHFHGLPRSFPA